MILAVKTAFKANVPKPTSTGLNSQYDIKYKDASLKIFDFLLHTRSTGILYN